jgi:hypothetical protein
MSKRKKSLSRKRSGGRRKTTKPQPIEKMTVPPALEGILNLESRSKAEHAVGQLLDDLEPSSYDQRKEKQKTMMQAADFLRAHYKKYSLSRDEAERLNEIAQVYDAGALAIGVIERLHNDGPERVHDNYGWYELKKARADEEEVKLKFEVVADPPMDMMPDYDDMEDQGFDTSADETVYVDHDSMVDEIAVAVASMANIGPDEVSTEFDYDRYSGHMVIEIEFPSGQSARRKYWRLK